MKISTSSKCVSITWALLYLGIQTGCAPKTQPAAEIIDPTEPTREETPAMPYPPIRGQEFSGEKNFARLINTYPKGKVEPTPWAGYFWPYVKNGIAAGGFTNSQSPAGKYDAARGNRVNSQGWEIKNHGSIVPKVEGWWGHCNGWAVATALFPEPKTPARINGIEFGVGDIKALLTEVSSFANADFFGERMDTDNPNSRKYSDTVPGQYFLVLTNYIGKLKHPVLIDRYTGSQVWNQPLAGYSFDYPEPSDYLGAAPEAPHVYRILLTSTLWWAEDAVDPDVVTGPFDFQLDDPLRHFSNRTLKMELWLDGPVVFDGNGKIASSGNIIVTREGDYLVGGAWRMGEGYSVDAWPDYMWVPYGISTPGDIEQDHVNVEIDLNWLKTYLLVPGGADDPSVTPTPVLPAPVPTPSGFPWPITTAGWVSGLL